VPWADLVDLAAPYVPQRKTCHPPFDVLTMLRIQFIQQWFTLSGPAMEEALHDVPLFREIAGLTLCRRLPYETTILRFRHLLEQHKLADQILATVNDLLLRKGLFLKTGTVVDATLIAAPSSTKNKTGERVPEMHQTKKGNQWYFGMKAHIGVDVHSGLVHTVRGTAANVNDVVEGNSLLHGQETEVFTDAGYQGADKRPDAPESVDRQLAMEPSKSKVLDKTAPRGRLKEQLDKVKASVRAKVEHPFRLIKRQFRHVKVPYRGLAKNTAQLKTLFALSNLWIARKNASTGWTSPRGECGCGLKRPKLRPLRGELGPGTLITTRNVLASDGNASYATYTTFQTSPIL
jgi:IS5 family transposase